VIDRFCRVATAPDQELKFPVGPKSAKKLGYDPAEVDALPSVVAESFCGVGNPFLMGKPQRGQTVLDLGCGAGLDTLLAAQSGGTRGSFIAVDMTHEMITKARYNSENPGLANIEFVLDKL
jgi:tRNA/tmRNA/rRNA uracil-C5-methylase (TrmA/RlmC/RlmD family)